MTPDDFKGWDIAIAALGGGALTFLARLVHLRRMLKRDGTEDELYSTLSSALEAAEQRRQADEERWRQREEEHVRVYAQSMEKLVTLSSDLAATKARFEGIQQLYAEALARLRVSDDLAKQLMEELTRARELIAELRAQVPQTLVTLPTSDTEGSE